MNATSSVQQEHPEWYQLDNAAIIFPMMLNQRYTTLFRMSVTLKERINITALEKAVQDCEKKFPYFFVRLKRGIFWHFIERVKYTFPLYPDSQYPCMGLPKGKHDYFPLRIRAFKRRIAIETSHYITDGTGALVFLKSLLFAYFTHLGQAEADLGDILDPKDNPKTEEWEDSFVKHHTKGLPPPPKVGKAFKIPNKLLPKGRYLITTGIMDVQQVKDFCKNRGVSITEHLAALYFYAFQEYFLELRKKSKKKANSPIRFMIPVNLRRLYPSKSLRNFFLTIALQLDPRLGKYSLGEIEKKVHHYMRVEVDQKYINQQINRNVNSAKHPLIRVIPLFLKSLVVGSIVQKEAKNYTSSLSNMGPVTVPDWMAEKIENFLFFPPPGPGDKTNCSILSFQDKLYISMGRSIKENPIERVFFRELRKEGLSVKIATNQEEE